MVAVVRHTYASLLIAQDESLADVRDQMGHHSVKVTVTPDTLRPPGAGRKQGRVGADDHQEDPL
jgi:hypothetical protein